MLRDIGTATEEHRPGQETGWEKWMLFATLFLSILSSLVHILELVSKSVESASRILALLPFVGALLWLSTIFSSLWILLARKRSEFDSRRRVERYDPELRHLARIVLIVAIGFLILTSLALVIHSILEDYAEEREFAELSIPRDKFGVVVSEFSEGPNFEESQEGKEITQLLIANLERDLQNTRLADEVVLRRWNVIRSQQAAKEIGTRLNADLVIWGWIPKGTENALVPQFTLLTPAYPDATPTPLFLGTEIIGLETVQLGRTLSGQVTILVACVKGFAYLHQADFDQAIAHFSDAITVANEKGDLVEEDDFSRREFLKDLSTLYVFRGIAYDIKGEIDAAKEDFSSARKLDHSSSVPYIALGNLYYSRGEWLKAEQQYSLGVEKSPTDATTYYSLGNAYFSQGKVYEATFEYEIAVLLQPDFVWAYFNLGLARESLGDCPGAIVAFHKVSEIAPDDPISVEAEKRVAQCDQPTPPSTETPDVTPIATPTPLPTVPPAAFTEWWKTFMGLLAANLVSVLVGAIILGLVTAVLKTTLPGIIESSLIKQIEMGNSAFAQNQIDEATRRFKTVLEKVPRFLRKDDITARAEFGLARIHALRGNRYRAKELALSAHMKFTQMGMIDAAREVEAFLEKQRYLEE
jgi:tetratricopeptide (TPR) repeat protein